MQKSSIKLGSTIMGIMGIFTLVFSILWIFTTEIAFISDVAVYTGQTWADFLASSPKEAELYIITKKLLGIQILAISIFVIFISKRSYNEGEKWSWYALLFAGSLLWGSMIGYRFVIGYIASPGMIPFIAGLTLFVIGLALPAKEILRKTST